MRLQFEYTFYHINVLVFTENIIALSSDESDDDADSDHVYTLLGQQEPADDSSSSDEVRVESFFNWKRTPKFFSDVLIT